MLFVTVHRSTSGARQTAGMFMGIGRGRAAKKVAAEHGLELDTKKYTAPTSYALLSMGSSRRTLRKMSDPAGGASVFDFDCNVTVAQRRRGTGRRQGQTFHLRAGRRAVRRAAHTAPEGVSWLAVRRVGRRTGGHADRRRRVRQAPQAADRRRGLRADAARPETSSAGSLHADEVGKSMMFEFLGEQAAVHVEAVPGRRLPRHARLGGGLRSARSPGARRALPAHETLTSDTTRRGSVPLGAHQAGGAGSEADAGPAPYSFGPSLGCT